MLICLIEIDGSQKSGSGTILRLSIALATIKGEPLHIFKIRQNRPKPGLQPQHLEAVLTAAELCNAKVKGTALGSRELWYEPNEIAGGEISSEIGTAGSISMLFMAVLPICLFAKKPVQLCVSKGGTDTHHSPTMNYLRYVFLETLRKLGADVEISVQRYGYYPKGNGEATLRVKPTPFLNPFISEKFGKIGTVEGISVGTFLAERKVAERQAKAATQVLAEKGYVTNIQIVNDRSNLIQKGSSISLWAKNEKGVILGADSIGEIRKSAESVGLEAAEKLVGELIVGATVDEHLADMLIPYVSLVKKRSTYLARRISSHLETNIWLAEKILGIRFDVKSNGTLWKIAKLEGI